MHKVSSWLIAACSLSMTMAFAAPAISPNSTQSAGTKPNVAAQPGGQQVVTPSQAQTTTQKQPNLPQPPAQSPSATPASLPPKKTATATPTPTPFVNNHYVLTGSLKVNGYHPGDPTIVIVDKGSHSTYVLQLQNNQVTRVLTVSNAIGKEEKPTPPGRYFVLSKKQFPTWIPPKTIDKKQKPVPPYNETHKNPLGVAAIFLNKDELALHGTNDPREIRQSASHGCVRHSNADISKIYGMVHKGDTVLIIREFRGTVLNKSDFKSRQAGADKKSSKTHHKSKSKSK